MYVKPVAKPSDYEHYSANMHKHILLQTSGCRRHYACKSGSGNRLHALPLEEADRAVGTVSIHVRAGAGRVGFHYLQRGGRRARPGPPERLLA